MESYKKTTLKLNAPLKETEKQAVHLFAKILREDGNKVEYDEGKINISLNELDYHRIKNDAIPIGKKYDTDILSAILDKIDSIKSYGIKGDKRLYVGYNKERKVKNRKQKEQKRGQYYYAADNDFSAINTVLSKERVNKIICADSETFLQTLPDNCVDLIFTSPPYNFGLDYDSGQDDKFWKIYFEKLFKIFDECIRVLKHGGRIIVNVQPLFSDYIPSHHVIGNHFMRKKMIWRGEILWEKNNYNCKYTAWGSWKSPGSPYLKYTWEFLEIFCKGQLKKEGKTEDADITAEEFKKWIFAKWSIAPERGMKKWGHPAMFPEKLVERVLKLFCFKNDLVLDPFNGVGTTTAVAKKLGRRYLGIDTSQSYCDIAEKRVKETAIESKLL